jgi:hypothetical protein
MRVVERMARSRGDEAGGAFIWALPSSVARESCKDLSATSRIYSCDVSTAYPVHVPFTRLLVDACSEQLGLGANADSVADLVDSHLF